MCVHCDSIPFVFLLSFSADALSNNFSLPIQTASHHITRLRTEMFTLLITAQIMSNLSEVLVPYVKDMLRVKTSLLQRKETSKNPVDGEDESINAYELESMMVCVYTLLCPLFNLYLLFNPYFLFNAFPSVPPLYFYSQPTTRHTPQLLPSTPHYRNPFLESFMSISKW